jgi:hypothetical protein
VGAPRRDNSPLEEETDYAPREWQVLQNLSSVFLIPLSSFFQALWNELDARLHGTNRNQIFTACVEKDVGSAIPLQLSTLNHQLKLTRCPHSLAATLTALPSMSLIPFAPFLTISPR